ncbi:MAG TPA: winged helix DNA-binding protein [Prevotella sp.]
MDSNQICRLRDVYRAIAALDNNFQKCFGLNINEAMLLCTLNEKGQLTSGEIADCLGLSCSNTSKVIASVEKQGLLRRRMGKEDRRQMNFSLTKKGTEMLSKVKCDAIELPEVLQKIV